MVGAGHVESVNIGSVDIFGTLDYRSAYRKSAVPPEGALVTKTGLEGDEQGHQDHGGVERAVNAFSTSTYAVLKEQFELKQPNGFGENLLLDGVDESSVCVGDIVKIAGQGDDGLLLQVSQPRYPCSKVNMHHESKALRKHVLVAGESGWFYRVLREGRVKEGDQLELVERKHPEWSIQRLQRGMYGAFEEHEQCEKGDFYRGVLALEELSDHPWKRDSRKWLEKMESS